MTLPNHQIHSVRRLGVEFTVRCLHTFETGLQDFQDGQRKGKTSPEQSNELFASMKVFTSRRCKIGRVDICSSIVATLQIPTPPAAGSAWPTRDLVAANLNGLSTPKAKNTEEHDKHRQTGLLRSNISLPPQCIKCRSLILKLGKAVCLNKTTREHQFGRMKTVCPHNAKQYVKAIP